MKKSISILLALLMVLGLAACMKVKAADTPATAGSKDTAAKDTAAVTAVPTPEPTPAPTPEPTEPPFDVAIAAANEKLQQVKSMHTNMEMNMGLVITLAMGEMKQSMPMDINMLYAMDVTYEPNVARADVALSSGDESMKGVIYVVRDGENVITYTSDDEGVTWKKNVNPQENQLPQSPDETLNLFSGEGADLQLIGEEEVNGKPAKVYTGTIDGKFLQDVLNSTAAAGELTEAVGADMSEEALANLSDIQVTIQIDKESGLPVQYTIDMADAMKELMMAAMIASMGGEMPEGMTFDIEISDMLIDMTLSDFDAIAPIEIPEAALNAPEL